MGGADLETGMAYGGYPFNGCTCRSLRNGSVSRRYKIASVVLDGERQFNLNDVREKNGSSNGHLEEKTNSTVLSCFRLPSWSSFLVARHCPFIPKVLANEVLPKRTLVGIIWSCILTVIICAWTSVHPNVPPQTQ